VATVAAGDELIPSTAFLGFRGSGDTISLEDLPNSGGLSNDDKED
jgi:hypothetical protein